MPLGRKHLRRSRDAPTGGIGLERTASRLGFTSREVKHTNEPGSVGGYGPAIYKELSLYSYLFYVFYTLMLSARRHPMKQADRIRTYAEEKYVSPARGLRESRFSIRAGDVVREMKLGWGRTPAVCSALKTRQFLEENALRLISSTGPASGQTTTVTYTTSSLKKETTEEHWIARTRGTACEEH